ncbi:MAG TPA: hypothetical protein VKE69_06375 [Planctomycetota bacterium]|nr:hypothetical protein [Planctomycetota bacterium]
MTPYGTTLSSAVDPQVESPSEFVVRVADAVAAREHLAKVATVEQDLGDGQLVVRVAEKASSSRDAWQRIANVLSPGEWAAPVMRDSTGEVHYPTGEVTVRFRKAPSDADLARAGARLGLLPKRRNEFVREQAVLAPIDARATFLPDVVKELREDPGVEAAWASTRSSYRRA